MNEEAIKSKNKIILLEDEEALGGIYKRKLEGEGFDVKLFKTADEVEKAIKFFKADIVLLDYAIRGEGKSGIDIISNIRKVLPNSKIVMLSNYTQSQLKKDAFEAGVDEYLIKIETPPTVLVDYVSKLLTG